MNPKHKTFKRGSASLEKQFPSDMYLVECRSDTGLIDRIRCDNYRYAYKYFKAFCLVAKNL